MGIGLLAVLGWVVMLLWNWIVPDALGFKPLSYWKAWGLLVLCTILFKGFGTGNGNGGSSDRRRKKQQREFMREDQEAGAENEMGGR
jgi:hypothetical protein